MDSYTFANFMNSGSLQPRWRTYLYRRPDAGNVELAEAAGGGSTGEESKLHPTVNGVSLNMTRLQQLGQTLTGMMKFINLQPFLKNIMSASTEEVILLPIMLPSII